MSAVDVATARRQIQPLTATNMRTALLLFLRANRRHLAELGLSSLLINTMMLALPASWA